MLTPQANTTVEPEFGILWPAGIGMINARLMSGHAGLDERLLDYFAQLDDAVGQFANAPVDVVALACTGASYLAGLAAERAAVDRLEQRLGVPFVTAGHAVTQALRALGAERIGLVSPYPAGLTDSSVAYWNASGFAVEAVARVVGDQAAFHPIYSIAARGATDALHALGAHRLDAIVMLGTGMPTLAPILAAPGILDTPTMSCMLCLGWAAVEAIDGHREGSRGTLQAWIAGGDWGPRLRDRQWPPG